MSATTTHSGANLPPIIFFGTEEHSLIALKALVDARMPVVAVVTKPDTPRGRGKQLTTPAVKTFALDHDIAVWQPKKLNDIHDAITQFDHPIGVLVSYGKIIPQSILDLFTPGIINLHPSLLPKYRGPSPIESAILNRDSKTGVTIMKLEQAMDAGPIYLQVPYALDFTETKPELYDTLFTLGANLLVQNLPRIIDESLVPTEQLEDEASYCSLLRPQDGEIIPAEATPGAAEAKIRAYIGYPKTRIRLADYHLIVTKAHGVMTKKTPLDLECSNGAFLSIDEVIAPRSGKRMSGADFLRGYPL